MIVAAHNEEAVIERRIENLLALDYPRERLEIVVTSDASTDRTEELALQTAGAQVIRNPRGGKVAAQDRAVRADRRRDRRLLRRERDLGARRAAPARRARSPIPSVAYVCGQLRILDGRTARTRRASTGATSWRVRAAESRLGSVTGGNGSIYARAPRPTTSRSTRASGTTSRFPYLMVQRGRRAVYEPAAHAFEKPTPTNETEYRRKVRMFEHCWLIVLAREDAAPAAGRSTCSRSSRTGILRYARGLLHLVLLATSLALVARGLGLRRRARRRSSLLLRRGGCRRRDRALLRARHLGDGRRALELPAPRRARDVGGGGGHALNRALDVAIAGAGLVVASPLLALAALAVKLEDGGPVLYRQTRVGKDGADFELLKLRTMVVGAETAGRRATRSTGATRGSRAPGASCAGSRSTSCRSSGTSCAATCR